MSQNNILVSPSVTEVIYFHKAPEQNILGLDEIKKKIREFEKLDSEFSINHRGTEHDMVLNIEISKKTERTEKLADFYFIAIILGFKNDNSEINTPFPKNDISILEKMEEKCTEKTNYLLSLIDKNSFGREKLIISRSISKIDQELIQENIFDRKSMKGDSFGPSDIYRSSDIKNRYFINIPVKKPIEGLEVENNILKDFSTLLSYYEKINTFYDKYYGINNEENFKKVLESEKRRINEILDRIKNKLKHEDEKISASEMGDKNSEVADALSDLAELNYNTGEQVDSIKADIFNLKSYMARYNHERISGLGSIFKEMERKGEATLRSYEDSQEDLRDLQDYLKLDSDIIQNHLEVEESRYNNRLQIAAFLIGAIMLFGAIIESLLYIFKPSSIYAFSPVQRFILPIVIFIPIFGLAFWYASVKKGRFIFKD